MIQKDPAFARKQIDCDSFELTRYRPFSNRRTSMAWIYLIVAGVFEWGWPIGLKFAWTDQGVQPLPLTLAIGSMVASGGLLLVAQQTIPVGTAYAVWTGIGAVGTFGLGIIFLGESTQLARFVCVGLIVVGIIGLKFVSDS
jgi:quaternary ammonium compound-resistance protein SugE